MSSNKNYGNLLAQGLSGAEKAEHPHIEGFEIVKKLGDGGMGSVYLAHDVELDRKVALKVFHQGSLDPMSLERIQQESKTMARAQHPNVLGIYHVKKGSDANTPFSLVLEYAAGGDLAQKIRTEGAQTERETIRICIQICEGLSRIHELGIIHRDIKPANILLTESGTAKVADLGIAKDTMAESLTMTGSYMGSILYVAPEQMTESDEPVDRRADIWSMGILIYELLVGTTPKAILESELMAPLPETIRPIVRRCLMQNPENRYQNIAELKTALLESQQPKTPIFNPSEKTPKTSPLIPIIAISVIALIAGALYFLPNNELTKPQKNEPIAAIKSDDSVIDQPSPKTPPMTISPEKNELLLTSLLQAPLQPDRGEWSLSTDGKLSCKKTRDAASISFLVEDIGNEYDLQFNVVRTEGKDSVAVFIPTSIGSVTFELDAWNKQIAGIQALDDHNLKEHEQVFQFRMTNGQNYHVLIKVRTDHVKVSIDGEMVYHCNIAGKKGSIIQLWDIPRKHPLSIGAWSSAMTFSDLVLKKIP